MNTQFKEGDIVIISDRLHGHHFKIGETVEILEESEDDYLASNGMDKWWVTDEELSGTGMTVLEAEPKIVFDAETQTTVKKTVSMTAMLCSRFVCLAALH